MRNTFSIGANLYCNWGVLRTYIHIPRYIYKYMYVCIYHFGYVLSLSLERRMRSLCLIFAFIWFVLKVEPRFLVMKILRKKFANLRLRWQPLKKNLEGREIFNAHLTFALTFPFPCLFQVFFENIPHRKLLFNCNMLAYILLKVISLMKYRSLSCRPRHVGHVNNM